jgi:D-beta-D-heptose 7-phosphate kinase/D-beta-D-heptose 1-phosphate adenosyltransferase
MINFNEAKVLVVGDIILDTYCSGSVNRISPEAPVPIVEQKNVTNRLGGAANVALNLASLGADVGLMGIVGKDSNAQIVRDLLASASINAHLIISSDAPTVNKIRILVDNHQMMRIDIEELYCGSCVSEMQVSFDEKIHNYDVVIFSDYAKGTLNCISSLISTCNKNLKISIVDPKGSDFKKYGGANFVTPNLKEFYAVAKKTNDDSLETMGLDLCEFNSIESVLVTKSEKGLALYSTKYDSLELPTNAKEVFDVTGAGDTVVAVLGACLAIGVDIKTAVSLSNKAAGIVVGKAGTSVVTIHELLLEEYGSQISGQEFNPTELAYVINSLRADSRKVVMTNGCFDVLHVGHIEYLEKAKALGDYLVVLVNDDSSVSRLKGDSRPINSLTNRLKMLTRLRSVDAVMAFSEDTPEKIYNTLLPNVLVKGADYSVDEIAGSKAILNAGHSVVLIQMVDGFSTTSLIDKMKGLTQ